jgi:hypothetical protein
MVIVIVLVSSGAGALVSPRKRQAGADRQDDDPMFVR